MNVWRTLTNDEIVRYSFSPFSLTREVGTVYTHAVKKVTLGNQKMMRGP
jgi:hypothetical protein